MHLIGAHPETDGHQLVSFANQLHVTILDPIVHHFDIMSGAILSDPVTTGSSVIHLGRNGLEDVLYMRPCRFRSTRHDGRAATCTLFSTTDTGADELKALGFQVSRSAHAVLVERIPPINNDVTGFQIG